MPSADYTDAFVLYLTKFPTIASLGDKAAAWLTELQSVSPDAFAEITVTTVSFEGGATGGVRNFAQNNKVRALYAVRAYLDTSFANPYQMEIAEPIRGRRAGTVVRTPR